MIVPWDIKTVEIVVTKHFALGWMRKWGWDTQTLRNSIALAYRFEKVGTEKFEVYVNKGGFRKIVAVYYGAENKLVCITGSQGDKRI